MLEEKLQRKITIIIKVYMSRIMRKDKVNLSQKKGKYGMEGHLSKQFKDFNDIFIGQPNIPQQFSTSKLLYTSVFNVYYFQKIKYNQQSLMSKGLSETNKVVTHAIKTVFDNFQYQLLAKETVKQLPQHLYKQTNKMRDDVLFVNNLPKPVLKHYSELIEQQMPFQHPIQDMLTGCVPLHKKLYQMKTPSTSYQRRHKSSRFGSSLQMERMKKNIHLNLNQIKQNKVIEIPNREQNTAKSLRSVVQLQSNIKQMRSRYLNDLKQQARLKMSMTQQQFIGKKKRIPKQFTFDFSGEIIQKNFLYRRGTVFSPLRTKSVSVPKVEKKIKKKDSNEQQQSNIQQKLSRINTGDNEKMRREYNNKSRRQISHIPFIDLGSNTKLYENNKMIEGPPNNSQLNSTGHSSHRTTFVHFRQKQKNQDLLNNESKEISVYPNASYRKEKNKSKIQGFITKNTKYYQNKQQNGEQFIDEVSQVGTMEQSLKFKDTFKRKEKR